VTSQADLTALPIFGDLHKHDAATDQDASVNWTQTPTEAAGSRRLHTIGPSHRDPPVARDGARVDWGLVRALRQQAAKLLADQLPDRTVDPENEREIGREIIARLLDEHVAAQVRGGAVAGLFTPTEQHELAGAVFDSLFGLGRLQPLVDDPEIETIEVRGHDRVTLIYAGGTIVDGPPVADSDEELLEQLHHLASRAGPTGRPFSETDPQLDLRLHGGHRLTASAWTTPGPPYVVIRRHRIIDVTLADLVDLGLMDTTCAEFLAACVRGRKSIVVAGEQGAGKTTLLRALCNEIDPDESVGTIETEFELHLDQFPNRHPRVFTWEARPGNGQVGADGTVAGEVTVAQLLYGSHRYNLSRVIVGEVRGGEVASMFQAMQAGAGSMSTIHADEAKAVVERLVTLAIDGSLGSAGSGSPEYAYRQVAHHIDLIVHIAVRDTEERDGSRRRRRVVSEVVAVDPGEQGRPALTDVFATVGGTLRPAVAPGWLTALAEVGYDPDTFAGTGFSRNGGERR
jgi:Flp pilus assembly CpaF family ATPase